MKSIHLLFITLIAFSASAMAQGFQLGIKAGANMTQIEGVSFNDEFKLGYHGGVFSVIKLGKKWGLQPEVLFNQYNTTTAKDFSDIYDGDNLKNVSFKYLTIPMLLNYNPQKWVSIQGGAQVGVLMDKNISLIRNGEAAFNKGEVSLLGGLQLNLGILKVSGRYFHGINNINKMDGQDTWKNRGYQLSVGLRII